MPNKILQVLWKFRFRLLVLAVLLALVAGCMAWFGYHWWHGYRQLQRLREALAAADGPDRARARELLQRCLFEDRNNEAVTVKLAELLEQDGLWNQAAVLWQRAAALNEFQADYRRREIRAMLIGRNFPALKQQLNNIATQNKLTPELQLYGAFGQWLDGNPDTAGRELGAITDAKILESPLAGLLRTLLANGSIREVGEWAASGDPVTAFEARCALGQLELAANHPAEAERWFLQGLEFNPEYIYPVLGNLYYLQNDYDKAIPAYRQALEYGTYPSLAMRLGELLAMQGKVDELKELSRRYRSGNKFLLAAGYYLDALIAYCDGNNEALSKSLKPLQGTLNSPVFLMLSLSSAINDNQPDEVRRLLLQLKSDPQYGKLYSDARGRVMQYISQVLIPAKRNRDAAALGALIEDPATPDLNLTRLRLLVKTGDNTLTQPEVAAALRAFPDDPQIIDLAGAFALQSGQFDAARRLAERGLQIQADPRNMHLTLFRAYLGLKDKDAALRELAFLTQNWPMDPVVLYCRIGAAVQMTDRNALESLQRELAKAEATPFTHRLNALIAVEIASLQKDRNAVAAALKELAQAEKQYGAALPSDWAESRPWEVEYSFRSALLLANGDEIAPAIAVYRRILDHVPNRGVVLLNLSELYAAQGDAKEALNCAKEAWEGAPDWNPARECYGLRLAENGQDAQALQLLQPLLGTSASARVKQMWTEAAEREVARLFRTRDFAGCRDLCNALIKNGDPHKVAQDYLTRIAAEQAK